MVSARIHVWAGLLFVGIRRWIGGDVFRGELSAATSAPYADNELAQVGAWDVQIFDLHVTAQYVGLAGTYEPWEDPRNYNFASASCAACKTRFGGKNCASTCSYCLFGGQCNFCQVQSQYVCPAIVSAGITTR